MTGRNVYLHRLVSQHKYLMCVFLYNHIKNSLCFASISIYEYSFSPRFFSLFTFFSACVKRQIWWSVYLNEMPLPSCNWAMPAVHDMRKSTKRVCVSVRTCTLRSVHDLFNTLFSLVFYRSICRMWKRNIK